MSVRELADECARVGVPQLTQSSLYNIERGQDEKAGRKGREVTADELVGLALALNVSPLSLLFPGDNESHERFPLTLNTEVPNYLAWEWGAGIRYLAAPDAEAEYDAVAQVEYAELVHSLRQRADRSGRWRPSGPRTELLTGDLDSAVSHARYLGTGTLPALLRAEAEALEEEGIHTVRDFEAWEARERRRLWPEDEHEQAEQGESDG